MREKVNTSYYISSFKRRRKHNRYKSYLMVIVIMLFTGLLFFILVDYSYPIPIDYIAFRINYALLILGIIWQIISLIFSNKRILPFYSVVPPSRRQPLFGKNLTRIRQHHPHTLIPFLHPIFLGHLITWVSGIPGAIISSFLIPGEIRKWKNILSQYSGTALALGASLYIIFSYIAIEMNLRLLTINIINAFITGLSVPGLAAIFYLIGVFISPHRGTPAKTIIGALFLFAIWSVLIVIPSFKLFERIYFGIIHRTAAGLWILLLINEIIEKYSMHKI